MAKLSLGLDASTQSLSAVIVNIESGDKSFEHSLDYRRDNRLNDFGIRSDYIIPPRVDGEADQPPEMFWAALDVMFDDIRTAGISLTDVMVINNSGQQHGHVYLNKSAKEVFRQLRQK